VLIHSTNGVTVVYPQDAADDAQPHGADITQKGRPTDGKLHGCAGGKGLVDLEGDAAAADVYRIPHTGLDDLAFAQYLVTQFAPDLEARFGSAVVSVHLEWRQGWFLRMYRFHRNAWRISNPLGCGTYELEAGAEIVNPAAPTDS
jgi:hypothetical protein